MKNYLRILASSYQYQFLYSQIKKGMNVRLFENESDLSKIQVVFLQWLEYYYNLNQSLAMKDDALYLTREVLEDELRCDAYVLWKSKQGEKSNIKKGNVLDNSIVPSMVFMKKTKK